MIPLLAPLFTREFSILGECLVCSPQRPADAVPVADTLHNTAQLEELLRRRAGILNVDHDDLRALASHWSLQYLWALLPPLAAAASLLHHVFPAAATDMAVVLDDQALPVQFHILHEGAPAPAADTMTRLDALLNHHLEPLFAVLSELTGLPRKILWGNAARYWEIVLDTGLASGLNTASVMLDKKVLLEDRFWPNGRRNPLYAIQRIGTVCIDGVDKSVKLHRQCCLQHLLPEESHCTACPLAPQHLPSARTPASNS